MLEDLMGFALGATDRSEVEADRVDAVTSLLYGRIKNILEEKGQIEPGRKLDILEKFFIEENT